MLKHAPVVYGKYQLLEPLARGGMAEVYKAKSHGVEGFEKILVIKRILPELSRNPQFVDMFINEAKIAVTLSHANIVQVFDLGRADETYFIAMEYVAGYDLATILKRCRQCDMQLPPELAVYIVSEVAKGLDYAHRRRDAHMQPLHIVHRDVSPQNVLLSYEGEVKITDFGIAKARNTVQESTAAGVLKGKYAYMSPEQANGKSVDARADLFGLGTVLFEILAGQNPFMAASTYDTLQNVRTAHCPPLHAVAPEIPEELSDIVALAMKPSPDARHQNAGRLYEDLIQFLYSSGRRVGAHDLSRFLDRLREATETRDQDEDVPLEDAFGPEPVVHDAQEATPLEGPRSKSGSAPATGSKRERRSSVSGLSTPHAERRDVTAVAILSNTGESLPEMTTQALLRRFGGTIVVEEAEEGAKKLVLLFGATEPDGRDTEAASRCALRIARAAAAAVDEEAETSVRLAVHAGRVLIDLDGEIVHDDRFETLTQATTALAARAGYGHVLVSPTAEHGMRRLFDLLEHGADAWLITGERSVTESYGKFVGRRHELRQIGEILALANKGQRRILSIVGEEGTGKSRLVAETVRRLRLGGHDVGLYLASITPQSRHAPLSAYQEMLRAILGIDELDPEPIVRDRVSRLREVGLSAAELGAVGVSLGLDPNSQDDGSRGQSLLRSAMSRIANRLSADRLTVLAFDGAESMDSESQTLLDGVLEDTRDSRLALMLAYRPGFNHSWASLAGYHEIAIGPLADEDVVRLTASRLGADEVPMDLLRDVTAKSGGNPLFVEEYLKALTDSGAVIIREGDITYKSDVAELEVPKTLRGIVAARISRLSPIQRRVLQIAVIAGQRFSSEVIAAVVGEHPATVTRALSTLEQRRVVLRQNAGEYAFTHILVAEVIRDGLTLEARSELHGAVASAIETLYPERVDEMAERLAEHFREAGNRGKAIDYMVRAADRLESEHALGAAIASLGRAIDMLGQTPSPDRDRVLGLYRRVGELSFRSRDLLDGAERMEAALELAEGLGREEYVARFAMMRGRLLVNANLFQEGKRWLQRARATARQLGNTELLRDITLATAEADTKNGAYSSAIGLLSEALTLSQETGDIQVQIRCLTPLSLAHAAMGDGGAALRCLEVAQTLSAKHADRFTECELLKTEALVHAYLRNHKGTVEASSRALELAKEYGFYYEATVNAHNLGEGYLRQGDFKRAFASLRYSYELAREHGYAKVEFSNLRVLGFIDAVRFNSEEGRARIQEAADYAEKNEYIWDLIQSRYLLAIADNVLGKSDLARQGFREVMRLSAEQGDAAYYDDAEKALLAVEEGRPVPLPQ